MGGDVRGGRRARLVCVSLGRVCEGACVLFCFFVEGLAVGVSVSVDVLALLVVVVMVVEGSFAAPVRERFCAAIE